MSNRDIEQKLKSAIENETPDILNSIIASLPQQQTGKVMTMKNVKNRRILKSITAVAAALVLVVGGIFAYRLIDKANSGGDSSTADKDINIYSVVTLDVNPSIKINVGAAETVLEVIPLNDEAKTVIGDMDFTDAKLDVAVNALIGSMVKNGYITELSNSILVSVDNADTEAGKALEAKLAEAIKALLNTDKFNGAVLSQTVVDNGDINDLAAKYGITEGKAQLIKYIIAADSRYTFESLVPLSINELNLLINSGKDIPEAVTANGTASEGNYIGKDKAKAAALAHAGVNEADILGYRCKMDFENGKMVYEIEFYVGNTEYEYDISATDGAVVKVEKDIEDDDDRIPSDTTGYIGEEEAIRIAREHIGNLEISSMIANAKLDNENGRIIYEVEIHVGGFDYEYDIDATTGEIVRHEKEYDDDRYDDDDDDDSIPADSYIGEAEAIRIAKEHAGLLEASSAVAKAELDNENGRIVYEVEIKYGNYEYDYEIDAKAGTIIRHSKELDD